MDAKATLASILRKHDFIVALLLGMSLLVVRHGNTDIVSSGLGINGGNYNSTGRNVDVVCGRTGTDNGDCRHQCQFKGGAAEKSS